MPFRLSALMALLFVTACAARPPAPAAADPVPAGITPLTLEQDRMLAG